MLLESNNKGEVRNYKVSISLLANRDDTNKIVFYILIVSVFTLITVIHLLIEEMR